MRRLLGGSKDKRNKPTKIFYATDLHGSDVCFRKFLAAAKVYGADVLVLGGDVIGKITVPIIREANGAYRASVLNTVESLPNEEALSELAARLRLLGYYYKVMTEDEFRELQSNPKEVHELFLSVSRERLQQWKDLANERLSGTDVVCYVSGGNDDYPEVFDVLVNDPGHHMCYAEGRAIAIDQWHCMASLGWGTPTPWDTPRETSEEDLALKIDEAVREIQDFRSAIFNFHDVPRGSNLDVCPKLDTSTDPPTPIVKSGQIVMYAAGSSSVREAIERYQPMLGLHGHIHESRGAVKIGRTLCVNPGSEYGEGVLRGCLIGVRDGEVVNYQLTSG